ncbi:helix-turn-helix domain-containing protein [Paracoccus sp. (in: a-proteobacteria)]|uniref:helix-turn-helix domain-containing protein n=1 Tax=Paracoccus sp. TaxID=267 RepID=UPI003A83C0B0
MAPDEIRAARLAFGLTQIQMAILLGYGAPARIAEIEAGRRNPSESVLRLMRAYLDGYRPADWPE